MSTFSLRLLLPAFALACLGAATACGGDETTQATGTTGAGGAGATSSTTSAGGASSASSTTGAGASIDCSAPEGTVPALKLTEVATGLSSPLLAKGAGGDTSRLYVLEQTGLVRLVKDGVLLPDPFLDIVASSGNDFVSGGEQGLLGLAFHPDFAENGRFFVHYSDGAGDTKIEEYHAAAGADVADATPVGTVLEVDQPEPNHNGGSIEFGLDGMLYVFLGDGGGGGDGHGAFGNGQNLQTHLGKVLRLDVATLPYAIPAGNLAGGLPEIWDYGVRNPWRDSFDRCTGDLYIGDVGQDEWEEVDVEPIGQGNRNYGWRCFEGMHDYNSADCGPNAGTAVPPVVEYSHNDGCTVVGGYVYRGTAIPGLRGTYFYGDYCSGSVWTFFWSGGQATAQTDITQDLSSGAMNISSFGQDEAGEIYLTNIGGGALYRIDAE